MEDVQILLTDTINEEIYSVSLPADVPISDLIGILMEKLDLPPGKYQLFFGESKLPLPQNETLFELGANNDARIQIRKSSSDRLKSTTKLPFQILKIKWKEVLIALGTVGLVSLVTGGITIIQNLRAGKPVEEVVQTAAAPTETVIPVFMKTDTLQFTPSPSTQPSITPTEMEYLDPDDRSTWPLIALYIFEKEDSGWVQGERDIDGRLLLNLEEDNGVYRIQAAAKDDVEFYYAKGVDFPLDIWVSADVLLSDTPPEQDSGLIFRYQDGKNYGGFGITSDAKYTAYFKVGNKYDIPIPDTSSPYIKTDKFNNLSVRIIGDTFSYYINGNQIAELTDERLKGSNAGIAFQLKKGENAVIEYDNFEVRYFDPDMIMTTIIE